MNSSLKQSKTNSLLKFTIVLLVRAICGSMTRVSATRRPILTALAIKLTAAKAISLYWLGTFIGVITPGRVGELVKVYFLKNRGESGFRSFFSVLLDE